MVRILHTLSSSLSLVVVPKSLLFFCTCSLQGGDTEYELVQKKSTDICTIMYTSGTTGDPKGVLISHEAIITVIAGVNRFLESANEQVIK